MPLILSVVLLFGVAIGYGQSSQSAPGVDKNLPTHSSPMKTGVQRHTRLIEIKADKVEACAKLFAAVPAEVAALYQAAHVRNLTCYLKPLGGKHYLITYFEYAGNDWPRESARLEGNAVIKAWRKSIHEMQTSATFPQEWEDVEEVFFTAGAADVVPPPATYARIGMITGLKPEKEAEYRTLHATTWPGVLMGIKDCHYRNFSIRLVELDGHLWLIGYMEYVGVDAAADAAASKSLSINKRWWKFTDACQQALPAAAAKGEIWDGMEEIHHAD